MLWHISEAAWLLFVISIPFIPWRKVWEDWHRRKT